MQSKKEKDSNKKPLLFVIGLFLVAGVIMGGNLQYIADWSTPELAGYNSFSIIAILGGSYMAFIGGKA